MAKPTDPPTTTAVTATEHEVAPLAVAEPVAPKAKLGIPGWMAVGWLAVVLVMAVLTPILPIEDPLKSQFIPRQGPFESGENLLGTDGNGRDVLARVVTGTRVSLLIGFAAVSLGLVIGGALGLYSGYFRNRLATAIAWIFDVLLAFPALVLALSLVAVLASGADTSDTQRNIVIIVALGVVSIPLLGRITRGTTLAWSQREFVTAARSLGTKELRIMIREVMPNVLPALFSIALLSVAVAIVAEGGLAVLGAGTTSISWGSIIASGRSDLQRMPHVVLIPSLMIFLTVLSLNYLGDIARARFDVRESIL